MISPQREAKLQADNLSLAGKRQKKPVIRVGSDQVDRLRKEARRRRRQVIREAWLPAEETIDMPFHIPALPSFDTDRAVLS